MSTTNERPERARRARGDDGAALVEFSLVAGLLFLLVFAIIHFGLILSFKQDLTRAAAEGARAGAVAFPATGALAEAEAATAEAVDGFGRTCDSDGMNCVVQVHDCDDPVPDTNGWQDNGQPDCVTVELVYDYAAHPLLVPIPLLSAALPDSLRAVSVARLNE